MPYPLSQGSGGGIVTPRAAEERKPLSIGFSGPGVGGWKPRSRANPRTAATNGAPAASTDPPPASRNGAGGGPPPPPRPRGGEGRGPVVLPPGIGGAGGGRHA